MDPAARKHPLTQVDLEGKTALCQVCGWVKIIVVHPERELIENQHASVRCSKQVYQAKDARIQANREIVIRYKRTHPCERCGLWSQEPKDFKFFEMHLPANKQVSALVFRTSAEQLEDALKRRAMYCRKCYRLIKREVTQNVKAPAVEPFSSTS